MKQNQNKLKHSQRNETSQLPSHLVAPILLPFHLTSPRDVIATDTIKPINLTRVRWPSIDTHPNSLRLGGTVKTMLAAVFQSAPLLQSKFWTCLYASARARAAASARAFAAAAAAAIAAASTGRSLLPVPEEEGVQRRRRRDATGSRR
jgi:hypothetical protein